MIKYSLTCEKDHAFEGWFPDSQSYDRPVKRGLVACPECNSPRVSKALMAPAVVGAKKRGGKPATEVAPVTSGVALIDERHQRLREMAKELRQEIKTQGVSGAGMLKDTTTGV